MSRSGAPTFRIWQKIRSSSRIRRATERMFSGQRNKLICLFYGTLLKWSTILNSFSAFGQTKTQWKDPPTPHPLEMEIEGGNVEVDQDHVEETPIRSRQKEKMRRELAAVFRLAKSSQDLAAGNSKLVVWKWPWFLLEVIIYCCFK